MTRPGAIGMRRAKDEATCDAEGRDPYVSPNRAGLDLPTWMKKAVPQ